MLPQHLQLSDPYLIDQLHFMQTQEETLYQVTTDYLSTQRTIAVSPSDRRTMCSWSYDIVDACSIDREVACIAMNYFDRFMTTSSKSAKAALMSRRDFQLAFIACLILALKCRAGMQVDSDFVSNTICQGMYNEKELVEMEKEILSALQWRLNGPSAQEFVSGLLELMMPVMRDNSKAVERLKMAAVSQVEMAMLDYDMVFQAPSSIAYAALLTAMNSLDADALLHPLDRLAWLENIDMVMGMKASDTRVRAICNRLFEMSHPSPMMNDDYSIVCTPVRDHGNTPGMEQEIQYCSPVSSEEDSSIQTEHNSELYLDVLSLASSSSDLSPVCAMLDDGRFEIQ